MLHEQERKSTKYALGMIGARTERGRCATSGSKLRVCECPATDVGDAVTYGDGSDAVILDGGGSVSIYAGNPVALDNGDVIDDGPHRDMRSSTVFVPVNEHGAELPRQ